ncbi:hypothetical protein EMIT079MI2_550010 [Bacillus sp. IT-79MI2]
MIYLYAFIIVSAYIYINIFLYAILHIDGLMKYHIFALRNPMFLGFFFSF